MEKTWFGSLKMKFARWFSLSGWDTPPPEIRGLAYTAPSATMWREGRKPKPVGGRGKKKGPTRRIDEFHPRGTAGRREVHAWKGVRKHALPHKGNRT